MVTSQQSREAFDCIQQRYWSYTLFGPGDDTNFDLCWKILAVLPENFASGNALGKAISMLHLGNRVRQLHSLTSNDLMHPPN